MILGQDTLKGKMMREKLPYNEDFKQKKISNF